MLSRAPGALQSTAKEQRILIVDDSEVDRMILQRAFHKAFARGISLHEAVDAQSALTRLEANEFDGVFLDINMPGHNGFYVLKAIRARYCSSWPLVFMYSSSGHPDDVAQAYAGQATAFFAKPANFAGVSALAQDCGNLLARACR